MAKIKEVTAGKYPADVRETLNQCAKNLNRKKEIIYGDVKVPEWQNEGDNKEIITLPKVNDIVAVMYLDSSEELVNVTLKGTINANTDSA